MKSALLRKRMARFLGIASLLSLPGLSQSNDNLFDLSLEQLSNLKISTGQLRDVAAKDSPSALTIISSDHISLSPAKNLAELLEIYVPGLMLMAHSEGDKIGIRGNIAAENYKLLMLINGKDITNMVYEGVITEIDQWDLNDIEQVEVVRGPGSVVYGSGAIAGIINIITKRADNNKSSVTFTQNLDYGSKGLSFQTSNSFGDIDTYLYGSYRKTEGLQNPEYYLPTGSLTDDNRFLGLGDGDAYGPQPYLGDTFDRPQIKVHLDIDFSEEFRLFTRYTQSGQLHHFRTKVPRLDNASNVIGVDDNRKVSLRSFIFAPEYTYEINSQSAVETAITYDTQEYIRYDQANRTWPDDHRNNIKDYAFSQNRWVTSSIYQFEADDWNLSTGYEFRAINIGAPWGKSDDYILVREGAYMISNTATSAYTQDLSLNNRPSDLSRYISIGDGLDFYTHSHLLEANRDISDKMTLHYGHRLDFPDISSTMFSPRLALISHPTEDVTFTTTAQRALRMMPLRAQYLVDTFGGSSELDHERIDSLEFSYRQSFGDNSYFNARMFYNDIDAVGFTGVDLQFLGNLKLSGLELEGAYKIHGYELLINHSFIKNIDFDLSDELKASASRNNISFSDYRHFTRGDVPIPLESYGDGINNWSDNSTKFIVTKRLFDNSLALQLNTQIYWDYNGSYDEMKMYQAAYNNFDTSGLNAADLASFQEQRDIFENERALLKKQDAFERQINVGASARYTNKISATETMELSLYVQNLFTDRKRYYVSTGSSTYYPNRLSFMKEPTVVTLGLKYSF